jgi:hypothetical protein
MGAINPNPPPAPKQVQPIDRKPSDVQTAPDSADGRNDLKPVVAPPGPPTQTQPKSKPSELIFEESTSFGNYRAFGSAEGVKLNTAGVEYDREVWPHVLGARVDYVAEVLPVVMLSQWSKTDTWGDPIGPGRETVPGVGISPLGFRVLWRDGKRVMPYWETKADAFGFTKKILAPNTTYENWGFNGTVGVKIKLTERYDLRVGVGDQHISNGNIANNPGVDVMKADIGLVLHLGGKPSPSR